MRDKSYPFLRTLSAIFIAIGIIETLSTAIVVLVGLRTWMDMFDSNPTGAYLMLGYLVLLIVSIIGTFAISQLIKLVINSADNIQNIADNVYLIASKNEEKQ
ncbi:hypothetical protein [Taibaiella soli]|nr:hypothetical protein [Taibaiella soli]